MARKRKGPSDVEARRDRLLQKARRNLAAGKSPRAGFTRTEAELLANRYSHYEDGRDDEGFLTESVLDVCRPDTPRPWLHLMVSGHDDLYDVMGSFWDGTGQGFLCYESALAGPVTSHKDTSYVPTAPRSSDVREFYLREELGGRQPLLWPMLPQLGREVEEYSGYACRYGVGWVTIEGERNQLHSHLRVFVPRHDTCEIWTITLTNRSKRRRRIKFFPKVTWGLEVHPSYYFDPRSTSEGRPLSDLRAIVAMQHRKANALPRTGFMMSDGAFRGFDLSSEEFTGGGHFRSFPRAVEDGRCTNSSGLQPYLGLIGALQFDLTLGPRASRTIDILVGRTEYEEKQQRRHLQRLRKKYFEGRGVEKEFARVQDSWRAKLTRACAETPDEEINRSYNVWLKYQQHNTARFTRALDQVGYRDVLQDILGICNFDPGFARRFIPPIVNHQLRDGRAIRQFFKCPDTAAPNDERMYSDSPAWIPDTLVTYLEETGDFALLDEEVGFYDLETHRQDNRAKKSVYEHALMGLERLFEQRGQKGLCLIGHGDWNDAMDGLSRGGRGVSTWLSMALVFGSQRMLKLSRYLGDRGAVAKLEEIISTVTKSLNENAWDGHHYVFGFNDDGVPVGTEESEEGRLHCAPNTWALFTGVAAAAGREGKLLSALERLWTPIGTAALDIPYTDRSFDLVGRVCDKVSGMSENGSVYAHGHTFFLYGLAMTARADRLYEELKLSLPDNTFPDMGTGPPHQQSNYAVGPSHPHYGMNLFSNFTGSTAWYLKTIDKMLGVLADFDGLRINPTAPSAWKDYQVRKQFRGIDYRFHFRHASGCSQVSSVTVDGNSRSPVDGEWRIPLPRRKPRRPVLVEVEI